VQESRQGRQQQQQQCQYALHTACGATVD
jgi:hypothetical protein